jgi:hypothetical protein
MRGGNASPAAPHDGGYKAEPLMVCLIDLLSSPFLYFSSPITLPSPLIPFCRTPTLFHCWLH